MRLAVFTNKYPAQTATFFERDMRALSAAGVELDVFVITPLDTTQWQYCAGDAIGIRRDRVFHTNFARAVRRSGPVMLRQAGRALRDGARALASAARFGPVTFAKTAYVLPLAWQWAAQMRAERYDHVLGYWGNYSATCAWAFHRLLGTKVPFSLWLHAGVDLYRTPVFMHRKLRYADNVVTCCEFNRDYIQRTFGAADASIAAKVHVSHHGLDLAEFAYQPDGRAPHTIMAVGRLVPQKGYEYLLRAAALLAARRVPFTIELVGDGELKHALAQQAARLGIKDRVTFTGWLTPPEARKAIARATMLVHPSGELGDGLPNVVREAMAVGTPVIASNVAGMPEALRDGCGELVQPRDVRALADAMQALLNDPARRREYAARARARVEERYDLYRNGQRLAELLSTTRRAVSRALVPPATLTAGDVA